MEYAMSHCAINDRDYCVISSLGRFGVATFDGAECFLDGRSRSRSLAGIMLSSRLCLTRSFLGLE